MLRLKWLKIALWATVLGLCVCFVTPIARTILTRPRNAAAVYLPSSPSLTIPLLPMSDDPTRLDINTASIEELQTLPGIGPVISQASSENAK